MVINDCRFEDQLPFFPYGVQYHRAPTPLREEWAGDLEKIASIGYTHVQFRPQWRQHERLREKCDWGELDKLFGLAHEQNLRVILKPMLETAPDWVYDDLDGGRIGFHGIPISPVANAAYYVGGWLPCFDNPKVMVAASLFVCKLVERYRNHPALWMYDAWNEPRSRPLGQCHCPHSQEAYRRWLQDRFETIEMLNGKTGKAWTSFASLRPPHESSDYTEMHLWRQWAGFAVSEHVRFVCEAIRNTDPDAFVLAHVGACTVLQDPICDTSDDILNAQHADRYGCSVPIEHHPRSPLEHDLLEFELDWMRRVDPRYWAHEFYANTSMWARPPTPETLRRQIWSVMGTGAAGFTFWQYRSERFGGESNGFGLRNIDGSSTARSDVADEIAGILRAKGEELVGTRRLPARVRLLHCRHSDMVSRLTMMKQDIGKIKDVEITIDFPYKNSLRATHCLYQSLGEETDYVIPGDDLENVQVLHVNMVEVMTEVTSDWLRDYVKQGGVLVIEYPFACRDDRTWVSPKRPNNGLDDLLGCTEADRIAVDKPEGIIAEDHCAEIAMFPGDIRVPAVGWRVDLATTTGETVAVWKNGGTAAVWNTFGTGKVLVLGINLSLGFANTPWDNSTGDCLALGPEQEAFAWMAKQAGLQPLSWANPAVRVRRRRGPKHEIWIVVNYATDRCKIPLPALPLDVWVSNGCSVDSSDHLSLVGGGVWVARMPLLP